MTSPSDTDTSSMLALKRDPSAVCFRGQRLPEPLGATAHMLVHGQFQPLGLHLHLRNHSPTGFEWGYGGSGPAQLALAMCVDLVDTDTALKTYQEVKARLVATIPQAAEKWEISGTSVHAVIAASQSR